MQRDYGGGGLPSHPPAAAQETEKVRGVQRLTSEGGLGVGYQIMGFFSPSHLVESLSS